MKRAWKYFFFLLWLSYLFICGILLFTRGFLLSRRTLNQRSSCVENLDCSAFQKLSKEDPSFENTQKYLDCLDRNQLKLQEHSNNHCTESKKKVVLLIIDALRYDFACYNHSLKQNEILPFQNRLTIIDELLTTLPNNSVLYKFIANPPTTTMQRLKGLTTGSLPTFIDVGSNFATPEIDEDNILDQLIQQEKKIVFMGDDTWTALYPGRFKRQYSYPSFNVWDLDTVDTGVITHLKPELQKKDWNLLIAHFLGVDHCGHKYGPLHPEMTRKLNQMNDVIKDVVNTIVDDTILFVMGDHGMTPTGDHGGESEEEVTSALFVYSPVPLLSENIVSQTDSVYQVDIVPTLSAILGFAIPFSNLGKVILSVLPATQETEEHSTQSEIQFALNVLSNNIEQIMLYINTYSRQTHAFSKEKISSLLEKFHALKWKLATVNDNKSFKVFHESAIEFLNYVRELCEEVWVQFDSFSMSRGLVLTFLLIAFTFFIIEGIPCSRLNAVFNGAFLQIAYGTVFFCIAASAALKHYKMVDDMYLLIYVSTLSISMFIMAVVVVRNWEEITTLWFNTYKNRDWVDVLIRFIHLCSLFILFSNSFVIEEGSVLSFMLNSVVWLIVYNGNVKNEPQSAKSKGSDKNFWLVKMLNRSKLKHLGLAVIFTILLRVTQYYWRCREEQRWCIVATDPMKSYTSFKSGRGSLDSITTLAFLALFVSLTRIWLRSCGNLVGFSPVIVLVRYAPSVVVVCLGGFWVLQGLPSEARSKLFIPWQLQILPWTVFALIGLTIICLFIQPVCVYVMTKKTDVVSIYGNENIIPQLFHQVKRVIKNSGEGENNSIKSRAPMVYGLATAYSAVFIILGEFVSLFIISLLGDALASSVVLMFTVIVVLLVIVGYARQQSALVTTQLFHVPWSYVVSWGLLASYFFYGTGHQPTFPGIHWYAAFVGTGGQFSSNYIPGFLIGANTFCSYILAGLLLPTLLIAPFALPVIMPKWFGSSTNDKSEKKQSRYEVQEGDISLYENEGLTEYALLKLAAKYILYHGTRIFACMLAAAIHCRHLMVWMIFTPRFIFEGLSFVVTLGSVLISYLLVMRVSTKIDHLMNELLKKHDL